MLRNGRHPTVIQLKISALLTATSHFYHDSNSTEKVIHIKSQVLLTTFYLWFVVEVAEVATVDIQRNFFLCALFILYLRGNDVSLYFGR